MAMKRTLWQINTMLMVKTRLIWFFTSINQLDSKLGTKRRISISLNKMNKRLQLEQPLKLKILSNKMVLVKMKSKRRKRKRIKRRRRVERHCLKTKSMKTQRKKRRNK